MAQVIIELSDLDSTPKVTNRGQYALVARSDPSAEATRFDPGEQIDLPVSEANGSIVEFFDPSEE